MIGANSEGRSAGTEPATNTLTADRTVQRRVVAEQARRRRAASRRCEPLADGRHDPLDRAPRPVVSVRAIGRRTIEFVGADRHVAAAIRAVGARHQRALSGGAWLVEESSGEDVLAILEHRGSVDVRVTL